MAGCRIVNASVIAAVEAIEASADNYKTAGEEFIAAIKRAIADMEGAAKDALLNFIETDVNSFVATDLPAAVKGMSELLEANRSNFVEVDSQLADSISG